MLFKSHRTLKYLCLKRHTSSIDLGSTWDFQLTALVPSEQVQLPRGGGLPGTSSCVFGPASAFAPRFQHAIVF